MRIKFRWNDDDWQWAAPMNSNEFSERLETFGIKVVDRNPDFVFADYARIASGERTIVFDRHDASALVRGTTDLEISHDVVGYMLPLRSKGESICKHVWGEGSTSKPVGVITSMLHHQLGMHHEFMMPKFIKSIDVSFSGTVDYSNCPSPWTEAHRRGLMNNWHQLSKLKSIGAFGTIVPRWMSWRESFAQVACSKVVVSPWGICEVSWRDYEALLGATMIVKPQQPDFELTVNPWNAGNTVYCKPDFSDLKEAVDLALKIYDEEELLRLSDVARNAGMSMDYLCSAFANQVFDIVNNSTC